MGWHVPCHRCGAQAGEPCKNLRTGKPLKNEHAGERYLDIPATSFEDLLAGHDLDQPIIIGFSDGTEVTGPTLRQLVEDQQQLEAEADKFLRDFDN